MKRAICKDCECQWDRKGNVKAIVLCEAHTAITAQRDALLEALEAAIAHLPRCHWHSTGDSHCGPLGLCPWEQARATITAVRGDV